MRKRGVIYTAFPLYRPADRRTVRIMAISPSIIAAFGMGGGELMIILVILLVLFGGTKLPSLARGLGQSIKEFKKSSKEDDDIKPADGEVKKVEVSKTHGAN